MTEAEDAQAVIDMVDLLRGRTQELALLYCARDDKWRRKPSFSETCANLLDLIDNVMAAANDEAEKVIDASGPNTMNRLRATSAGEG